MQEQNPIRLIDHYGLKPTTKRKMSLFGASCVAEAYVVLLNDLIGLSYGALGVCGNVERLTYFMNEEKISELVGKSLLKNKFFVSDSLVTAKKLHNISIPRLNKGLKVYTRNPLKFLTIMVDEYPKYMVGLGIYNCFWRYLGDDYDRLNSITIKKIASRRDKASILYPRLEAALQDVAKKNLLPKKSVGGLLTCFTKDEINQFLRTGKTPEIKKLKLRARAYFFLLEKSPKRQLLITDDKLNKKIEKKLTKYPGNKILIHGHVGYPGLVRGTVYNLDFTKKNKLPIKFILVASATNPSNLAIIRKSSAIVSDEGGILSHAAIVARELKIPCVIGTKMATKLLNDGDEILVDAHKGFIKIIKRFKK